jgi:hypothetical protein
VVVEKPKMQMETVTDLTPEKLQKTTRKLVLKTLQTQHKTDKLRRLRSRFYV